MIFLYGPPGSGKSTVGRVIAESLGLPFWDLDEEVQQQDGSSIPAIFAAEGEPGFRRRETAALQAVLTRGDGVLALGGGALLLAENCSLVQERGQVYCLSADLPTLLDRISAGGEVRPLLAGDPRPRMTALLMERRMHYASFSEQIDTTHTTPEQVAWEVQTREGRFRVGGMGRSYDVCCAPGVMGLVGKRLKLLQPGGRAVVVSDTHVAPLYAERVQTALTLVGIKPSLSVIQAGEAYKTMETVSWLWKAFLEAGLERGDTVVALGGGVVGDLAGFAAAVFLRGVNWVVLPTSLLAMVDSSLGGKTGIDLPEGKNLVGAFCPPRMVLADPLALRTLPDIELRSGLAEVVKHGVIGDPQLFESCAQGWDTVQNQWAEIARRAMAVKVRIIQEDPFEKGQRAALNLGHTIGHAIEQVSGYQVRHGEAVAIGMVAETRLAERLGLAETGLVEAIAGTLDGLGLPTEIPLELDRELIKRAMRVDKKRTGGALHFSLPVRMGEVQVGVEVAEDQIALDG